MCSGASAMACVTGAEEQIPLIESFSESTCVRRVHMLKIPSFDTFDDAYRAVLEYVSSDFEHVNAPRGNAARECLNISFALTDPRDRLVYAAGRRANIVFCY